ncbi:MAG: hypothetical protein JW894_05060 [Bacteroidales bacterium]|nr:hypothetical protein [Bacteroidales bacterium]
MKKVNALKLTVILVAILIGAFAEYYEKKVEKEKVKAKTEIAYLIY